MLLLLVVLEVSLVGFQHHILVTGQDVQDFWEDVGLHNLFMFWFDAGFVDELEIVSGHIVDELRHGDVERYRQFSGCLDSEVENQVINHNGFPFSLAHVCVSCKTG